MSKKVTIKKLLERDLLAWLALRHFFSAVELKELCDVVVICTSEGKLNLDSLFEQVISLGPPTMASWAVKPRVPESALAEYLQHVVRNIIWRRDLDIDLAPNAVIDSGPVQLVSLQAAVRLSTADLNWSDDALAKLDVGNQQGFSILVGAIRSLRSLIADSNTQEKISAILSNIGKLALPLRAVIAKHLGDLSADLDGWQQALDFYEFALVALQESSADDIISELRAIALQSRATALGILRGPADQADVLASNLWGTTLIDDPLLEINSSHDELVAKMASPNAPFVDRRTAVTLPPLLQQANDLSNGLQKWLIKDHDDAYREFWSVLRRQISLGLASETRNTKAFYARFIFDEIQSVLQEQKAVGRFAMGVRLLIESGNRDSVERIGWNSDVVHRYVDAEIIELTEKHAERYAGVKTQRVQVVVELFKAWLVFLAPQRVSFAKRMLKYLAALALEYDVSVLASENLGGKSFEALREIAKKRPELRKLVDDDVAAATIQKLTNSVSWKGFTEAVETAYVYLDVFSDQQVGVIADKLLALLEKNDPRSKIWPVTRPALKFLTSPQVRTFAANNAVGQRIVTSIVRLQADSDANQVSILYNLYNFDPSLMREPRLAEVVIKAIDAAKRRADAVNASDAVDNIQALLLSSAIGGRESVQSAIHGLSKILETAVSNHPSIGLAVAYEPILLICRRWKSIAEDISIDPREFETLMESLVPLLIEMWRQVKVKPTLFAPFSFPPATVANRTIVHNWTYASITFAGRVARGADLKNAVEDAKENLELRDAISIGQAVTSEAIEDLKSTLVPDQIRLESRDVFYATIGLRLAALGRLSNANAQEVCKALLDQCFRYGPVNIDAAVFMSANSLDIGSYIKSFDRADYMRRLENSADSRQVLAPILNSIL